ncbi:MAG: glycosyltransferase family 4 protein [Bacteroidia bacterium]|nr:glycosyltransferase family 4 protein [Bacteroidia bacterium]
MKKLFVIGHTFPEPTTTAAGKRMMQLLQFFSEHGYEIDFGSTAARSERSAPLESSKINTHQLRLNDSLFDEFLKELNPQVVIFDRYITEEQFGWRVAEVCPNAVRVLDTEDLHFLRKAREVAIKAGKPLEEAGLYTDITKRELASILRCDLSLIISETERDLLKNNFSIPEGLLHYLPFLINVDLEVATNLPAFSTRRNFVTIGNFQHSPNADGVKWLAKEIWPEIRNELPNAEMHVYGAYASRNIADLHNETIGFLIKAWASNKKEVMSTSRVCLVPLRFGAGLKGKIVDAMLNGTPSVTTKIGAEGINGDLPFGGVISETTEGFIQAAVRLYTEENEWEQHQSNGFRIIQERFDKNKFTKLLNDKIFEIQKNVGEHRNKYFIGQILQHHTLQTSKYMSKWIELKNKS